MCNPAAMIFYQCLCLCHVYCLVPPSGLTEFYTQSVKLEIILINTRGTDVLVNLNLLAGLFSSYSYGNEGICTF